MTELIEFLLAVGLPILAWRKMVAWMTNNGHGKWISHLGGVGIAAVSFFVVMMVIVTIDPADNDLKTEKTVQTAPEEKNSTPQVAVKKQEDQLNPEPTAQPEPQPAMAAKMEPSPQPEKKEETPPLPSALKVSAVKLFNDYSENEVAADDKYKEKSLEVGGVIESIDKQAFGGVVVRLKSSNPFMPVDANLSYEMKEKAGKLKKGQKLIVRCEGDGLILGSPQLSECQF